MQSLLFASITVDKIDILTIKEKNIRVSVLRLDKIHPIISGNKWFKLKYYLEDAAPRKKDISRHIWRDLFKSHYCYSGCRQIVQLQDKRHHSWEQPQELSYTLLLAKEYNMQLIFVPVVKNIRTKKYPKYRNYPKIYLINEGVMDTWV
jgi:hypothetical protein